MKGTFATRMTDLFFHIFQMYFFHLNDNICRKGTFHLL